MADPSLPRRNVELKAADRDPSRSLAVCARLGAEDHGELHQRDRYFPVPSGRLKLREETPGEPHLIQYHRPSSPDSRLSAYRIVPVTNPELLAQALGAALGAGPEVLKHRRLFLWNHVRIHLDRVAGLGNYIEFEAVAAPESDLSREHELVRVLRAEFAIADGDLVSDGYTARLSAARAS